MRVILSGTEHVGGLAALRALRAAGYEPWAAVTSPDAFGARSRAAVGSFGVPDPRLDPEGFVESLAETAARLGARLVLPGTEPALLALAGRDDAFPARTRVGACSQRVTVRATDKSALAALASDAGIETLPMPVTVDGLEAFSEVTFPAIVKPLRSELPENGRLARFDARPVADRHELARALEALPDGAGMAQPYVEGGLLTVNGVAWEGEVVASIHKRAARTWPLGAGVVSYAQTVRRDPELEEAARAVMGGLGWSGVFNLQFIDGAEGRYLIDLNPRLYTSLGLAHAAGVNVPAIWAELLQGRRPEVPPYRTGVRFRSEDDLRALVGLFVAGRRADALRGLVPRPRTVHALFSLTDPRPVAALARKAALRLRSIRASGGSDGGR